MSECLPDRDIAGNHQVVELLDVEVLGKVSSKLGKVSVCLLDSSQVDVRQVEDTDTIIGVCHVLLVVLGEGFHFLLGAFFYCSWKFLQTIIVCTLF
ncbi:hypothetical protein [Microcoleus sp. AT9b-C2]|uniref:hypothetical protein n=1 Tax=Microcoleus sp. AT9b-C2 TaxID=2818628 RepID=UPI002FCF5B9E